MTATPGNPPPTVTATQDNPKITRRRRGDYLSRISIAYGDIVLLTLVAGIFAKITWHSNIAKTDWLGFIYVAGDIAGLLAYFGFILFATLHYWSKSAIFWRSLHPLNFGLALVMPGIYHQSGGTIILLIGTGAIAAVLLRQKIIKYPRAFLTGLALLLLFSLFLRWGAPFAWRQFLSGGSLLYGFIAVIGGFLIFAVLMPILVPKSKAAAPATVLIKSE